MAGSRIRTIKPEILDDEKVAKLSDRAFRLFIACISMADDYGNLRGSLEHLRGQVFWGREEVRVADVRAVLDELVDARFVEPYQVRGQPYLHLRTWDIHQKVDRPGKPKMPGPADADEDVPTHPRESRDRDADDSRESRGSLAPDLDQERKGKERDLDRDQPAGAHDRPTPVQAAQLLQEHGAPRLVLTLDNRLTATGLSHVHENQLAHAIRDKGLTCEDLQKLGRWLNEPSVWTHLKAGISAQRLFQSFGEAIDLSRDWDGRPIAAAGKSRAPPRAQHLTDPEQDEALRGIF